jgi:hypothetical protein
VRCDRAEDQDLVAARDRRELVGATSRFHDVTGGERDLRVRGQEAGALERLRGLAQRAADRRSSRIVIPLAEA